MHYKNWFKPFSSFPTDHSKEVSMSQFFVRLLFHLWGLLCHYVFLISYSSITSGRLWCVNVALTILTTLLSPLYLRKCLFVLRFYGPNNPMGSCRARSIYLTTRLLCRQSSNR